MNRHARGRSDRLAAFGIDPTLSPCTKSAFNQQITEPETERSKLLKALSGLRGEANVNADELSAALRGARVDSRAALARHAPPAESNRLAE